MCSSSESPHWVRLTSLYLLPLSPRAGLQDHPHAAGNTTMGASIPSLWLVGLRDGSSPCPELSCSGSCLLPPELQQSLLHLTLCTQGPFLPREMTAFPPWLLCQLLPLVIGVGSTWPGVLPCSGQLPSPGLGRSSRHGWSPVIWEQTSQTPSASSVSGTVPA